MLHDASSAGRHDSCRLPLAKCLAFILGSGLIIHWVCSCVYTQHVANVTMSTIFMTILRTSKFLQCQAGICQLVSWLSSDV